MREPPGTAGMAEDALALGPGLVQSNTSQTAEIKKSTVYTVFKKNYTTNYSSLGLGGQGASISAT